MCFNGFCLCMMCYYFLVLAVNSDQFEVTCSHSSQQFYAHLRVYIHSQWIHHTQSLCSRRETSISTYKRELLAPRLQWVSLLRPGKWAWSSHHHHQKGEEPLWFYEVPGGRTAIIYLLLFYTNNLTMPFCLFCLDINIIHRCWWEGVVTQSVQFPDLPTVQFLITYCKQIRSWTVRRPGNEGGHGYPIFSPNLPESVPVFVAVAFVVVVVVVVVAAAAWVFFASLSSSAGHSPGWRPSPTWPPCMCTVWWRYWSQLSHSLRLATGRGNSWWEGKERKGGGGEREEKERKERRGMKRREGGREERKEEKKRGGGKVKGRSRMERERKRRGGKEEERWRDNLIFAVDGNYHPIILCLKKYIYMYSASKILCTLVNQWWDSRESTEVSLNGKCGRVELDTMAKDGDKSRQGPITVGLIVALIKDKVDSLLLFPAVQ